MKKKLFTLFSLVFMSFFTMASHAEGNIVYLRGSFNNWEVSGEYIMRETFDGSDVLELNYVSIPANANLKFDVYGNWSYNFGDNNPGNLDSQGYDDADQNGSNIVVYEAGTYDIIFNKTSKKYKISKSVGEPENKIKLFYKTGWDPATISYSADSASWQNENLSSIPGYSSYKYIEIDAFQLEFVMSNNLQGHYDNNEIVIDGGSGTIVIRNYFINFPGTWTLEDGVIKKGAPDVQFSELILEVDNDKIMSNGTDKANFTVKVKYPDGTLEETDYADIYNGSTLLTEKYFTSNTEGVFSFKAELYGIESNSVIVTAEQAVPTTLLLLANSNYIGKYETVDNMYNLYNEYSVDGTLQAELVTFVYDQFGNIMNGIEIEYLCAHHVPYSVWTQHVEVPANQIWLFVARTKGLTTNLTSNIIAVKGIE